MCNMAESQFKLTGGTVELHHSLEAHVGEQPYIPHVEAPFTCTIQRWTFHLEHC